MEKHVCKLCFRRFSNGRALGGHMRSHVIAARPPQPPPPLSNSPTSSSSSYEAEKKLCYGLRENPRKSVRLADPEFSSVDHNYYGGGSNSLSAVVQDRESDTESAPSLPPVGGKRRCREYETEPMSSVSNTTPDEDVAFCLVMLSRDAWSREGEFSDKPKGSDGEEDEEEEEGIAAVRSRRRGRYQCETCKKAFGSYQALGGHRASHKKVRSVDCEQIQDVDSEAIGPDAKIHECPFCFRVFPSGQALGGHKRSHLINSTSSARASGSVSAAAVALHCSPIDRKRSRFIDLNLPAPTEEADDGGSQVEYSAVSNTDF